MQHYGTFGELSTAAVELQVKQLKNMLPSQTDFDNKVMPVVGPYVESFFSPVTKKIAIYGGAAVVGLAALIYFRTQK